MHPSIRPDSWTGKFAVAGAGILRTWKTQSSMKIHGLAAGMIVTLGGMTGLSMIEWAVLLIVIGLVIGFELLNTALEAVVNLASPEFSELARNAKDAASGAVLIAALTALGVGGCLFLPHWMFE